ncbi:hypothetical protein BSIN_0846 [Burkholderia singularis]|uniref:Uncharacterized protein n=1 Tax=Burkholderia singularis TaxID=1503053 RepID=A0A238HA30_9BURK|nr:hypothetical protein BSIN_0846 [Burkholderia singularis]
MQHFCAYLAGFPQILLRAADYDPAFARVGKGFRTALKPAATGNHARDLHSYALRQYRIARNLDCANSAT